MELSYLPEVWTHQRGSNYSKSLPCISITSTHFPGRLQSTDTPGQTSVRHPWLPLLPFHRESFTTHCVFWCQSLFRAIAYLIGLLGLKESCLLPPFLFPQWNKGVYSFLSHFRSALMLWWPPNKMWFPPFFHIHTFVSLSPVECVYYSFIPIELQKVQWRWGFFSP